VEPNPFVLDFAPDLEDAPKVFMDGQGEPFAGVPIEVAEKGGSWLLGGAPKGMAFDTLDDGCEIVALPEAGEPKANAVDPEGVVEKTDGLAPEGAPKGLLEKGFVAGFEVSAVLV
jgi:hypothetical protein